MAMTPAQEAHLKRILSLVDAKYRSGAEAHRHSDPLMAMPWPELIDNILAESVDRIVYLASLRDDVSPLSKDEIGAPLVRRALEDAQCLIGDTIRELQGREEDALTNLRAMYSRVRVSDIKRELYLALKIVP